jgi:predicted N-acetyltransferase YhbS
MAELDKLTTRLAQKSDCKAISELHSKIFGPGRFARSAYRVRERSSSDEGVSPFCRIASLGSKIIASITFTEIKIGETEGALLLGPVAVDPNYRGRGIGSDLIKQGLDAARSKGRSIVLLVGDEPYYGRFGFKSIEAGRIFFPGPVDPKRLLGLSLKEDTLSQARGMVTGG